MAHRLFRAASIAPHRSRSFKLSIAPAFVEKVRDITGLHLNPPDNVLVLCVDEKSQIQALDAGYGLLEPGARDLRPEGRHAADLALLQPMLVDGRSAEVTASPPVPWYLTALAAAAPRRPWRPADAGPVGAAGHRDHRRAG